jgi:ATP-dependent helicase/nuclease subunit B
MADPRPRVFTIPASAPFLQTLIRALVDGRLIPGFSVRDDPAALASATIYLPTRRACRLAGDLFLGVLGQDAALLPRLSPIGDLDEDELVFAESAGPLVAAALELPPALGALERQMLLAQLIMRWAQSADVGGEGHAPLVAATPVAALALAQDLARLIDDMITRRVAWSKLDGLVPDNLDVYWRLTLEFLKLARVAWPAILEERGVIEVAERRDRLIDLEAARLATWRGGPVIAAGSTASMPSTAHLLGAIASMPYGAVVLPGLDMQLDAASWELIGSEPNGIEGWKLAASVVHPQFAMHGFVAGLGMRREEVETLAPPAAHGRERLVSEALRPAEATDLWNARLADDGLGTAMAELAVIEAANAEEEALAIAVALREAVDIGEKDAALVTPDRALARRVMAALARWNVEVDDSGGETLAETPAGVFARLAADAALGGLEPVTLLALLKHPLLRLGAAAGAHADAISILERAVLRGPRPRPGTEGLAQALASVRQERARLYPSDPRRQLPDRAFDAAAAFVERLRLALAPLEEIGTETRAFGNLAERHERVLRMLGSESDVVPLFDGSDGRSLLEAFDEIFELTPAAGFAIAPAGYTEMFHALAAGRVVRQPANPHARVRIFGLLEARLQHPDRVVLGGLTEGVWPPQTRSDPWLSRPMRQTLGLDLPERRIGLTAHDFAQAFGCREVILSRADKLAGAPTVPSRFLQRLAAVAGKERWDQARKAGVRYVALARSLDRPVSVRPVAAPTPKPPLAARPKRLSVTEIEHWLRDPYTIYAKHILRLRPLDAVDTMPGARDRGSAVHDAIEAFTKASLHELPADALGVLLALGEKSFAPLKEFPEARAFWWPRFERVAHWFANWERERRGDIVEILAEIRGEIDIPMGEQTFKLTCRADRIERRADGTYALLDYKTGQIATASQVRQGLAPQLTLEAAIVQQGGFKDIPAGAHVAAMSYVRLHGGDPAGQEREIVWKDTTPQDEAAHAFARLTGLLRRFAVESEPYRSMVHPMWTTRYGDYDHLARVKEWSASAGADNAGGDA